MNEVDHQGNKQSICKDLLIRSHCRKLLQNFHHLFRWLIVSGSCALGDSLLWALFVKGAQRLLERLGLLLTLCNPIFIGHASLHTCRLQLIISWMDLSSKLCSSVRLVLSSSIMVFVSASSPSFASFVTVFVPRETLVVVSNSMNSLAAAFSAFSVSLIVRTKSDLITSSMPKIPVLADCPPLYAPPKPASGMSGT